MSPLRIRPTPLDRTVARFVARKTTRRIERNTKLATRLASERVVYGAAFGVWLLTRFGDEREQREGNHVLASIAASAILQRALKQIISQERPDRVMLRRTSRKGVPRSGNAFDSFPSGHATNLGVLAPAMAEIWPRQQKWIWAGCLALAGTRVVLLAHWLSDVAAGLMLGCAIERIIRPMTGSIRDGSNEDEPS